MSDIKVDTVEFDFVNIKQEYNDDDAADFTTEIKIDFENMSDDNTATSSKPAIRLTKKYFEIVYLNDKEMETLIEVERQQLYNGKVVYKCEHCNLGYKQQIDMKRHRAFNHSKSASSYNCSECKRVLQSQQELMDHWQQEHSSAYRCKTCSATFRTSAMMKSHLSTHESLKIFRERYPCNECDKIFYNKLGLSAHIDGMHKQKPRFPCQLCHVVCRWETTFKKHMENHTTKDKQEKPPAAYCASCDARFASSCSYHRHLTTSKKHVTPDKFKYVCDDCNRRYPDKTSLRDHIEVKHLQIFYKCHTCSKIAKSRRVLKEHIRKVHRAPKIGEVAKKIQYKKTDPVHVPEQ